MKVIKPKALKKNFAQTDNQKFIDFSSFFESNSEDCPIISFEKVFTTEIAESNQIEIVDKKILIYPNNFSPEKTSTYSFDLVATTKGQKIGSKSITITITVIENQSDSLN